jgi:hypothetical protein
VFLTVLAETADRIARSVLEYRFHADIDRLLVETYGAVGDVMKYASYHIGNLRGRNTWMAKGPETEVALKEGWFQDHFLKLDELLGSIWNQYRKWEDKALFELIGDLADSILDEHGVIITPMDDDKIYVHVP